MAVYGPCKEKIHNWPFYRQVICMWKKVNLDFQDYKNINQILVKEYCMSQTICYDSEKGP